MSINYREPPDVAVAGLGNIVEAQVLGEGRGAVSAVADARQQFARQRDLEHVLQGEVAHVDAVVVVAAATVLEGLHHPLIFGPSCGVVAIVVVHRWAHGCLSSGRRG